MGTRFVVTQEAPVHGNVKSRLVKGSELDIALILRALHNTRLCLTTGLPSRSWKLTRG